MAVYTCPVCALAVEFGDSMPAGYACPRCMCPGERFARSQGEAEVGTAACEEACPECLSDGVSVDEAVPSDVEADVRAVIERAHASAGRLLASAWAAQSAGMPETGAFLEHVAHEAARHAARLTELLGEQGGAYVETALGECARQARDEASALKGLASRAQAEGQEARAAALCEAAADQVRLAAGSQALLGRLFG